MTRKKKSRSVALIYDAKLPYDVKVMSGVAAYLQKTALWNIYIEESALHEQCLPKLGAWRGDGILADMDDPRVAAMVLAAGIPTVAFGSGHGWYDPSSGIPYFYSDNQAVAHLVADHLSDRGFRQFAYYGYRKGPISAFSVERAAAFRDRAGQMGRRLWVHLGPYERHGQWESLQRRLIAWLESLPKPIGLMAANDKAARHILEACHACNIRVPEDVAVVGVDNDEMLCQLSTPPLSSVEQGAKRIGFQAAALLDSMMSGRKPRRQKYVIPPEGIVIRHSSDIIAVENQDIAAALALIQTRACSGLKVSDIADAVALSRSQLDRSFKAVVGRTIHDEIRRVRLDQAKRLLAEASLPLKQISARSGFRSVQHMTEVFSQFVGVTPAIYRRQHAL
jgi:LacI family transcriptional regulator